MTGLVIVVVVVIFPVVIVAVPFSSTVSCPLHEIVEVSGLLVVQTGQFKPAGNFSLMQIIKGHTFSSIYNYISYFVNVIGPSFKKYMKKLDSARDKYEPYVSSVLDACVY